MRAASGVSALFQERGDALVEESSGAQAPALPLHPGEFYQIAPGIPGAVSVRPTTQFMADLPRNFRDTLQARLSRFTGTAPPARALGGLVYAQVEDWLKGPPALRGLLPGLWQARLADPDFRASVAQNLQHHPEWAAALRSRGASKRNPKESP